MAPLNCTAIFHIVVPSAEGLQVHDIISHSASDTLQVCGFLCIAVKRTPCLVAVSPYD